MIDELHYRCLVDILQSSSKQFWAISAEIANRIFEHELQHRAEILWTVLSELGRIEQRAEQPVIWTVDGQTTVTERVLESSVRADDKNVYMTVEELRTEALIEGLGEAAERGVSIKLAGMSTGLQARLQDEIPGATMFESLWVWSDTSAGRLMMVDGRKSLVSTLVNCADASPSDPRSETAIWWVVDTNNLVVVLKAIFTWRLDTEAPN